MSDLQNWLFDAPWWIPLAAGVFGLLMALWAMPRRDKLFVRIGLAIVLASAVWYLLAVYVKTPEERAMERVEAIVEAFDNENWDRLDGLIDPDTRFANRAKGSEITRAAESTDDRLDIRDVSVTSIEARRDGLGIIVDVRVHSQQQVSIINSLTTAWRFDFRERGGAWRLEHIEPRPTERLDVPSILRQVDWGYDEGMLNEE